MTTLSSTTAESAHSLLDYRVLDQSGTEIGTVHSFWADAQTGKLEFLGVKTGWLFGQNHVMPVDKVEIDEASQTVRVPYTSDFVKGAMSLDADSTVSDEQEAEIYRYYGVKGGGIYQDYASTTTTDTAGAARLGVTSGTTGAAGESMMAGGSSATADTTRAATAATGKDDIEVALTEEQVRVGKRTVDAGQVRLRKIVRTEVVNQPVEIRHEDVVIERVSADQVHTGAAASNFEEEVIDVPLTREEVVVQKDAHVTGAVRLHKTAEAETQTVSETVRKEDVEVLRDGKTVTETAGMQK